MKMFVAALFIIVKHFLQAGLEICGIEYNEMNASIRVNMSIKT